MLWNVCFKNGAINIAPIQKVPQPATIVMGWGDFLDRAKPDQNNITALKNGHCVVFKAGRRWIDRLMGWTN